MILVALGTHDQPFDRALDVVRPLENSQQIVFQHGHTAPQSSPTATWREFVSYGEMVTLIEEADAVICHAGVGTILSTLATGKVPVVIPRLKRFGEHVDDHQLQIATAFEKQGFAVCCDSADALPAALEQAARGRAAATSDNRRLRDAVGAATRRTKTPVAVGSASLELPH